MNTKFLFPVAMISLSTLLASFHSFARQSLNLEQAVALAQKNDPWQQGNRLKQTAIEARSHAALTMADPKVSISALNMPVDGFEFDQEAMTQLKVGISQTLPRGDTLAIKNAQLKTQASQYPLLRANRHAMVQRQVSQLWLDAYLAQTTIALINKDKALFEQMVDIALASYASAVGKTRQQDVISAQLELIRLDDRLMNEQQKLEGATAQLSQWFYQSEQASTEANALNRPLNSRVRIASTLPKLRLSHSRLLKNDRINQNDLANILALHPAVKAIDVTQQVANKGVELANQQYKPQWGVNASYAYRDDAPSGIDRSDFFSVGVTFDLPLFTENRQDKQVAASIAESEAVKTDKLLLMRNMIAEVEKERRNLQRLAQRQALYESQLIKQTHEQAEAALTAYTNDDGDFSEVVSARISELNTMINKVKIDVEALKTVSRLNYFLSTSSNDLSGDNLSDENLSDENLSDESITGEQHEQ